MNLKSCVGSQKLKNNYIPHKLRSRPLKCITLPIIILFLFIVYWFITCPLIFVRLLDTQKNWPKQWPYYFWFVALIVFIILLAVLICIWRASPCSKKKEDSCKYQTDLLLNNTVPLLHNNGESKRDIYTIPINTIQMNQDKFDSKNEQSCINTINLEEKLEATSNKDKSVKSKPRPDNLKINVVQETKVELHSTASPLTPRDLFFWDLIQSANRSSDNINYNFIEHEKQHCSLDNYNLNSPKSKKPLEHFKRSTQKETPSNSSNQYFIANVPDRKSLTTEAYLYVDSGKEEKYLKIRTNKVDDDDDEVFRQ